MHQSGKIQLEGRVWNGPSKGGNLRPLKDKERCQGGKPEGTKGLST